MIPIYTNGDLSFNIFPCSPKMLCDPKFYCQAQFKFSCSSVQFELRLSLKPGYYHPPILNHPSQENRDTVTSRLPRELNFGM